MTRRNITILPARNCRRSRKVLEYLAERGLPFRQVELESPEGQALAGQYDLRASPGILVDGASINPFDLLLRPECRVDEAAAQRIFEGYDEQQDELK
jgi:hypothetical protein